MPVEKKGVFACIWGREVESPKALINLFNVLNFMQITRTQGWIKLLTATIMTINLC